MKTNFTISQKAWIFFAFSFFVCLQTINVYAQAPGYEYDQVLYRVNSGSISYPSQDASPVNWSPDGLMSPYFYVDTTVITNKTLIIEEPITPGTSVPASVPAGIFQSERSNGNWNAATMELNFPVPAGIKVEIRLYFAEIYFDAADMRLFDIMVEGAEVLSDFDIYAEAGARAGIMKSFTATSDGNIDIDLVRVKQQQKINGVEIISLKEVVLGTHASQGAGNVSVMPNPFSSDVKIGLSANEKAVQVEISNALGKQLRAFATLEAAESFLADQTSGIYYLNIHTGSGNILHGKVVKN